MLIRKLHSILFICLLIVLCLPAISFAQVTYEGQVINKTTELTIPGVSVVLLKEKIGTQTNNQGYFILTSPDNVANDTLVFSSVGYKTFRLPISAYQRQQFIELEASNTQLNQVTINNKQIKTIELAKFNTSDLKTIHSRSYTHITYPFYARALYAKQFEAPQENVVLTSIQLGRRDFEYPKGDAFALTTTNKYTRFLVHVMVKNFETGQPGAILFTKEVTLTDNAQLITIDLSKEKLVIAKAIFFIAIEWLRIPFNEVVRLNSSPKVVKTRKDGSQLLLDESAYKVQYQPCLVEYVTTQRAYSWIKIDNTWRQYISPYGDVALSATIHY